MTRQRFVIQEGEAGEVVLEPIHPCLTWDPVDGSVGSRTISGAGVPAAYVARRDALLDVRVRLMETELGDAIAFLRAAQLEPLRWYPDSTQLDPEDGFDVFLESPAAGEAIRPQRDTSYQRLFVLPLVLRAADADVAWPVFFA